MVPRLERGVSQSRKPAKVAELIEYVSQPLQIWWMTSGTQPPPEFSASVTYFSIVASGVSSWRESGERIAHASWGGVVSPLMQPGQPTPPTVRALA